MARYSRSKGVSVVLAVVLIVCLAGLATAQDKFPSKAINNVVFSSAGGGTDVISRFLALQMEKTLGQKMIVSNMPGGLGGTAAEYVWQQSHDGYTLLGVSETATTFLVNGATKHGISDWVFYIAAGSPGIIAVKTGSPYQNLDALLKAAKDRPKTVKIGNSGTGKLWHIKVSILERNADVQFMHVPYNGSNPAILSVLSGETNAVSAAFGEVSEQVRAGKMKIIAVTEADRIKATGVDTVPSLTEVFPAAAKYLPLQQWLGFAVPKDVPAAVQRALGTAFEKAVQSPEANLFFKQQYMERIGLWGEKANAFAQTMESGISWISKELGVAKNDPAALNMAKPAWMK